MNNVNELKDLIKRYESITLSEIQEKWEPSPSYQIGLWVASRLTGFGFSCSCKMCSAVREQCHLCVQGPVTWGCALNETYLKISRAKTPRGLLLAFRRRAKYLREKYSDIL